MKVAILLIALVPMVFSARIEERFIESLLGGYDILDLAKQLLSQFGCDETEAQCESTMCPQILDPIDGHNALITGLVCTAVCNEAQVLAKQYGSGAATGVDPCTGGGLGGLTGRK
ncbi:hypothetical protein ACF0H5_001684 [Mactra antiquata]